MLRSRIFLLLILYSILPSNNYFQLVSIRLSKTLTSLLILLTEYDMALKWMVENGGTGDFFYIR